VLNGSTADYQLKDVDLDGQSGKGLYQGTDLVALIQGDASRSLNLNNQSQVQFVTPAIKINSTSTNR